VPCDCRRFGGRCDRPVEVCLQFDTDAEDKLARGLCRRLSADAAKQLVRWADKKGLMHTTDLGSGTKNMSPICNCCADDCYVFRAAAQLSSKGVWPRIRYLVTLETDRCTGCGACVKRCHFGALALEETVANQQERRVTLESERCWGCGLCANTCPAGALNMMACDRQAN
jgi:NAD-dependent dihydropyrimidine dehydrogenase PreA subunit